jgi:DNA repair exonuclease SbcCD ATPase subunit
MNQIDRIRRTVDRELEQYRSAKHTIRQERKALAKARAGRDAVEEARKIAHQIAEAIQREAHEHIAGLVSRCLSTVFGKNAYEFRIIFEKKYNKTSARLVFFRDGIEVDPMSAAGGGVIDVAAFALRLSVIMTRHPPARRLLVMDEAFKHVSADYRKNIRDLLNVLSEEMDVQIILVTHDSDFLLGKVVHLS